MDIDFSQLSASAAYFMLTQTIVPRPIAWILSENADGSFNLAPFSFFNALCSDPPLLGVSIGKKADGAALKDTRTNILERQHFVLHIAQQDLLPLLNASAASLPQNVSEVTQLGLATTPMANFTLPRLTDCYVALACAYVQEMPLNDDFAFVIGEVKHLYLAEQVAECDAKGRVKVNSAALQPLARLGAGEYATLGEVIKLTTPR